MASSQVAKQLQQPLSEQRWMLVVKALNQPGTLTASAAVFSNRGVSLQGFLGSGIDTSAVDDGRLLFSFRATEEKQALLKRSLERLPNIFKVDAYRYDDKRLRAIAIAKLSTDTDISTLNSLHIEVINRSETALLLLLTGKIPTVEEAIAHFRKQQQLKDVVMSAITV
ncbi:MAG: hypothetical protein AAFO84_09530 [Cyanobacteria bacterium J06598_1]